MAIHTSCRSCGVKIRASDQSAGRSKRCPKCGDRSVVPPASTRLPGTVQLSDVRPNTPPPSAPPVDAAFRLQCPYCLHPLTLQSASERRTRIRGHCASCRTVVRLTVEVAPARIPPPIIQAPDDSQEVPAVPSQDETGPAPVPLLIPIPLSSPEEVRLAPVEAPAGDTRSAAAAGTVPTPAVPSTSTEVADEVNRLLGKTAKKAKPAPSPSRRRPILPGSWPVATLLCVGGILLVLIVGIYWLDLFAPGPDPRLLIVPGTSQFNATGGELREPMPREWIDARDNSLQQGYARIRVTGVSLRPEPGSKTARRLSVYLRIEHTGPRRWIRFLGWPVKAQSEGDPLALLTDAQGKSYTRQEPGPGDEPIEVKTIGPRAYTHAILYFDPPPAQVMPLRLLLPAEAVGGEGPMRWELPRGMIDFGPPADRRGKTSPR